MKYSIIPASYTKALLAAVPRLGSMKGRKTPAKFANVDINQSEGGRS